MDIINYFKPEKGWRIVAAIFGGALIALIALMFHLGKATSYLSDDPNTCVNCHVMTPQYSTWMHSSHREHTNCNSCHVPQDNVFRKYYFKAMDGARHSMIFTLGTAPEAIMIHEAGQGVVQENCIRCHIEQVNPVSISNVTMKNFKLGEGMLCWDCHRDVPHGGLNSQSSTPHAMVPDLEKAVPEWIQEKLNLSK